MADGNHTLTAKSTTAIGNNATSTAITITVDTTAPAAPTIVGPAEGTVVTTTTPTVSGMTEALATVEVFEGATSKGTVVAAANGSWSLVSAALTQGAHALTAKATDTVGNVSAASAARNLTVDSIAPVAPTIATPANGLVTNTDPIALTGATEINATVTISEAGLGLLGATQANAAGSWSFTTAPLGEGAYSFTAAARDVAGNTGMSSLAVAVTIDKTPPSKPTIATPASGTLTNDETVDLTGTADANTLVEILETAVSLGTTTADGLGNWAFTTPALGNGQHPLKARAIDAAGNASGNTNAVSVTVDISAPNAPIITTPAK